MEGKEGREGMNSMARMSLGEKRKEEEVSLL